MRRSASFLLCLALCASLRAGADEVVVEGPNVRRHLEPWLQWLNRVYRPHQLLATVSGSVLRAAKAVVRLHDRRLP